MEALSYCAPPSSLADLFSSFIAESITQNEPAVIHAGHYALIRTKDGQVTDCLDDEESSNDVLGFAEFSRFTWSWACQTMARTPAAMRPRLIVLVNDWQYVEPKMSDKRESKQAADRSRTEYYFRTPTLPQYHLDELEHYGLSTDGIVISEMNRWLFSENALRNELHPIIREVQTDEHRARITGIRKYFNENGEPIIEVCDDEAGKLCLLHCGNTNCAGEVISLLGNLYRRGVRRFLNVYPSQCREPVSAGTRLAYKIFNCPDFVIVNAAVAIPSANNGDHFVSVERFCRGD